MIRRTTLALVLLGCATAALAQTIGGLKPLPRPGARWSHPTKTFAAYDLPFQLPRQLRANALYETSPFYAVILLRDRAPSCDEGEYTRKIERFRREAQTRFPDRKVFADHQCPNMDALSYAIEGQKENDAQAFVAVYAGTTRGEGETIFRTARRRYPAARLARMKAGYSRIVQ